MSLPNLVPLRDPRPLYLQAEEALIRYLAKSEPGEQLPPEPELAQSLGVSRSTLREALRALKAQGLIAGRRGVGTFVQPSRPPIPGGLETLRSLDAMAAELGLALRTDQVLIEEKQVSDQPQLAEKLGLGPEDQVVIVSRVKLAGDKPVAYIEDMIPAQVASAQELRAGFEDSVLDYLLERNDPRPDHARAHIQALPADQRLATKLEQPPGAALLLLEEVLFSTEGKPIDYSRNYFNPGFTSFYVIRQIKQ